MSRESQYDRPAHRSMDWVSAGSFLSAAALGLGTIANTVRHKFYQAVVLGFGETDTPFTPIVREYTGDPKNNGKGGKFAAIVEEYNDGKGAMTADEYLAKMKSTATEFRAKVDDKLLKDFKIPTTGFKGWTIGTWKRFENLGITARRDSVLGFAAVTAIGIGGLSILRQSKHNLDRIEDRLDEVAASKGR